MLLRPFHAPLVDANVVDVEVGLRAELGDRRPVDRDASLLDELFRRPPRGDARGGDDLLEPNFHQGF